MQGRRNPFVAQEGLLPMALIAAIGLFLVRYSSPWFALPAVVLLVVAFLVFRDPRRDVPSVALGVVSPVDGEVTEIEETDKCVVQGRAYRIRLRIDALGAYTARSPVEGKVLDLHSSIEGVGQDCPANALWVRTDEGDSVVLEFSGYRLGLPPRSFIRFGERIGQGHRCAYLRLARYADVYMPIDGKVRAQVGQHVIAGSDLLGTVPRRSRIV